MMTDPYEQTTQALLALGGQRVWSLMVTLFGDLAQDEGTAIDGPVLSAVMTEMDVRPEAVRVALHRLRNDGWIGSEKIGRTRRHSLTIKSRAESAAASTRIYADPADADGDWQLVVIEETVSKSPEKMLKRGFIALMPRVYLGAETARTPKHALTLNGGEVPKWLSRQIAPKMLTKEYCALLPILKAADSQLKNVQLNDLQQAVLRCLIVHNWRRIVLRHPPLPRSVLPEDWEGHKCHALVNSLLDRFPRPILSDILTP